MGRRAQTSLERPSTGDEDTFAPPALSSFPDIKPRSPHTSPAPTCKKKDVLDYIYTETYGGIEFYKRMAKRAESAMQLEQKHFQLDLDRSHEIIHRLKARIAALEVMAEEKDTLVENYKRKIKMLRHQLQYNSKAFERDLSYLRLQVDHTDRRLGMALEENRRKGFEYRHELEIKQQTVEQLQVDLKEIVKSIEEPLQTFYLPDYFLHRNDGPMKTEGMKIAAKILKERILYEDLVQETKQKTHESDTLADQIQAYKKEAEEAIKNRDAVFSYAKTFESVPGKIEGLDRILAHSVLVKDNNIAFPSPKDRTMPAILERLEGVIQAFVTKADETHKTLTIFDRERTKLAASVKQLWKDLALEPSGQEPQDQDVFALLGAIKEHSHKKAQQLERLHSEKASTATELEAALANLKTKHNRLIDERNGLAQSVADQETAKEGLEKKVHSLQRMVSTISNSLQAGKYDAAFEEEEAKKIMGAAKSLHTEKVQLSEQKARLQECLSGVMEMIKKPGRTPSSDPLRDVLVAVRELKEETESVAGKSKQAEHDAESLAGKLKKAEHDKETLAGKLKEVEHERQSLAGQLKEAEQSFAGKLKEAEHEKQSIAGKLKEAEKSNESLAGRLKETEQDKQSISSKLKEAEKSNDSLAGKLKETEQDKQSIAGKLKETEQDKQSIAGKLKEVEQVAGAEKKTVSQLDSTLQQAAQSCETLKGTLAKLQPIFGEQLLVVASPRSFSAVDLANIADAYGKLVPKVVNVKQELESTSAKLESTAAKLESTAAKLESTAAKLSVHEKAAEDAHKQLDAKERTTQDVQKQLDAKDKIAQDIQRQLEAKEKAVQDIQRQLETKEKAAQDTHKAAQETQRQLDAVRHALGTIQALFPNELGKTYKGSEAEDTNLVERIKKELQQTKETKEKEMGRANSLSLEASLLDPVLTEVCGAVKLIEQEIGASLVQFNASETTGKASFVRDRLLELKGLLNAKMQSLLEENENHKGKLQVMEGVIRNAEKKTNDRVQLFRSEIARLGGYDVENKQERLRRVDSASKVKDVITRVTKNLDPAINPLVKLAAFQVDLLVNNKAYRQLEVSGPMGGLSQAAIHYFKIDRQNGEVSFESASVPGSQSSNMLIELMLNPASGHTEAYESRAGDILGLAIKVKSLDDQNAREILYNSNVIHTDEVMDAIKGQTLDNFSLWPDLISSWKWERSPKKGWTLVCIKWRFLLKSIFPELSEPLQQLAIPNRPMYDRSQTIKTLG